MEKNMQKYMLPELEITPSGSRGFSHTAMLKSRGDRGIRAQTRFSRGPPSPPRSQFRPLHHCALLAEPCPDVSSPFLSSPSPCYHLLYTQISFFIGIKLSLWINWEELMNLQSLFLGIFYFSIYSNLFFFFKLRCSCSNLRTGIYLPDIAWSGYFCLLSVFST